MRTLLLSILVAAPLARGEEAAPDRAPAAQVALAAPATASSGTDPADLPPPPAPPATPAATDAAAPRTGSRFGVQVETGLPEGLAVGVTFRPVSSVRLWAGPAWNYVSFGGQLGVAIVPFRWALSPVLSLEAGRYFRADLSRFVNEGTGAPKGVEPLLKNVSYDYAAAHLGFELGSQRGFAFSVRAGLAYVRMATHGSTAPTSSGTAGDAQVYFVDPRVNATIPSVKLGFQYSF
ncbi:hypothetical protein [Anaeromyxobacter oryzae]|uniref:Outer membrane protein beta-barrel domain-containing protein n=1 Tax=Anaeromyxobacter oryzae TaxID=2918170 RepID=A0ABN6MU59_9BACT|nr:hypothetical protein [Anaeromyxobacter oryzae]BDG04524.1 hypothetical protein AMOR_35200 [Anaeromyxobacter oryzae]